MNKEDQRVAIAVQCGWKDCDINRLQNPPLLLGDKPERVKGEIVSYLCDQRIPNYPDDLNAMHEAESVLTDEQQHYYAWLLVQSVDNHMTWKREEFPTIEVWEMGLTEVWFALQAPASNRSETFLRATGLWVIK